MKPFQHVVRLKQERRTAKPERQGVIDQEILKLEPQLTHEEAVYLVKKFEVPT